MKVANFSANLRVLKNLQLQDIPYDKVLGFVSSKIASDDDDFAHILQRKSRWQLILLSAAVCGIEFCYAAETAFVSPTLLQIGVPVYYMTLIWCLSPLLGFLLVPLLGSLSDRCQSRLGRRRPFILLLSTGILAGLVLVPWGEALSEQPPNELDASLSANSTDAGAMMAGASVTSSMNDMTSESMLTSTMEMLQRYVNPWSILVTVIGVIILDFSCDACQSPCRAYLLDVTVPEDHPVGLTTFTVLAGGGGSLGYIMGGINWGGTSLGSSMGSHVRVVFSMVFVIYLVCLCLTLTAIKEIPLNRIGVTKADLQRKKKKVDGSKYRKFTNEDDDDDDEDEGSHLQDGALFTIPGKEYGSRHPEIRQSKSEIIQLNTIEKQTNGNACTSYHSGMSGLHVGSESRINVAGVCTENAQVNGQVSNGYGDNTRDGAGRVPADYQHEGIPLPAEVSLTTYLLSIVHMPRSLFILSLTNLFCWMSLVCYSLYFTDFVGQAVFGGDPSAPSGSEPRFIYEAGVRWGSFAMSLYSISCSFYSLVIEKLVNKFGAKPVYVCSQLVYTVGALIMALWKSKVAVILLSPTAGIMYATLFTMPYLLVAHYHSTDTFEDMVEGQKKGSHVRGLGTDIALVSSMVFFAQFLLSLCMGSIVHLAGTTAAVIITASILSFCGAVTATQVLYAGL